MFLMVAATRTTAEKQVSMHTHGADAHTQCTCTLTRHTCTPTPHRYTLNGSAPPHATRAHTQCTCHTCTHTHCTCTLIHRTCTLKSDKETSNPDGTGPMSSHREPRGRDCHSPSLHPSLPPSSLHPPIPRSLSTNLAPPPPPPLIPAPFNTKPSAERTQRATGARCMTGPTGHGKSHDHAQRQGGGGSDFVAVRTSE